jgi:translation elongation factor EF-4
MLMLQKVFVGAFPVDQSEFTRLDDSIQQLVTNDRSVTLQKESSEALGQGWRLGFLGRCATEIGLRICVYLYEFKELSMPQFLRTAYGRSMVLH